MGKVWALFTDNSACEIKIRKPDVDIEESPKFTSVGIRDLKTNVSADKALRAAFSVLMTNKWLDRKQKYSFSYEYKGLDNYIDSSASLAFALGLVMKNQAFSFSIAATGVIEDSFQSAKVEKVNHIEYKIPAAINVLNPGDIIFYPQDNHEEISQDDLNKALLNKITLQPVDTVEDAVFNLFKFSSKNLYSRKKGFARKNLFHIFLILLVSALIVTLYAPLINHLEHAQQEAEQTHSKIPLVVKEGAKNNSMDMPVETKEISEKKQIIRLKFGIKGNHRKTVLEVQRIFSDFFQNNGFVINNRQYDGIISGNVKLTEIQEIPLRPYAPPHAVIVQYRLSISDLAFSSKAGDTVIFSSKPYLFEMRKNQEILLENLTLKNLIPTDTSVLLQNIKSLYH